MMNFESWSWWAIAAWTLGWGAFLGLLAGASMGLLF